MTFSLVSFIINCWLHPVIPTTSIEKCELKKDMMMMTMMMLMMIMMKITMTVLSTEKKHKYCYVLFLRIITAWLLYAECLSSHQTNSIKAPRVAHKKEWLDGSQDYAYNTYANW